MLFHADLDRLRRDLGGAQASLVRGRGAYEFEGWFGREDLVAAEDGRQIFDEVRL